MKVLLKIALISGLMALASCAHHRGGCGSSDKCSMGSKKDCQECCSDKAQCPMKDGAKAEEKKEEVKK